MKRVKMSTDLLHVINAENKSDSWEGLIIAAESEMRRIKERHIQLKHAVTIFRRKKLAGDPLPQLNGRSAEEQHSV